MKLLFSGGARSVSGSLHVIEAGGKFWFVDCGLFQGNRRDMYDRNAGLPVKAENVAGIFLSHAHVDHSGRLPRMINRGFRGPVYATQATIDLCRLLLFDSAYILRSQTASLNRKRELRGLPPLPHLYTEDDVEQTLDQMTAVEWNKTFYPAENIDVTFSSAGHILGASNILIKESIENNNCSIAFSGDLGRENEWVMPNPSIPGNADHIVIEGTYGDREHRPYAYAKSELCENLKSTICSGGKIIIPAFSVGRTQRMLYELNAFMSEGIIPEVPIYLDSPLSIKASEVFLEYADTLPLSELGKIDEQRLKCIPVVTAEESKLLINKSGPYIVITASGMCEAGRVLYHLKENLPNPASRVLFVGFCAENTLGRQLTDGQDSVKILGNYVPVNASIDYFDTFSAHADRNMLAKWVSKQKTAISVFIVHGEEKQSFSLAEKLEQESSKEIIIPFPGEQFELTSNEVIPC